MPNKTSLSQKSTVWLHLFEVCKVVRLTIAESRVGYHYLEDERKGQCFLMGIVLDVRDKQVLEIGCKVLWIYLKITELYT